MIIAFLTIGLTFFCAISADSGSRRVGVDGDINNAGPQANVIPALRRPTFSSPSSASLSNILLVRSFLSHLMSSMERVDRRQSTSADMVVDEILRPQQNVIVTNINSTLHQRIIGLPSAADAPLSSRDREKRWQYADKLQLCIRSSCQGQFGVVFYNCAYKRCVVRQMQQLPPFMEN